MIEFTVHGLPIAQGSKRVVPTKAGPRAIESNSERLRPWRAQVSAEAGLAMRGHEPLTGPVQLRVEFMFPRPKSHYGTGRNADKLKETAPTHVAGKPDLDKLARALGDALTGIVLRDDSQIASLWMWKRYGASARMQVQVRRIIEAPYDRVLVEA